MHAFMWWIFILFVDHLNTFTYLSIELTKHCSKQNVQFSIAIELAWMNPNKNLVEGKYGFCVTYLRLKSRHSVQSQRSNLSCMHTKWVSVFVNVHSSAHAFHSEALRNKNTMRVPYQIRDDIDLAITGVYGWIVFIFADRKNIRKTVR